MTRMKTLLRSWLTRRALIPKSHLEIIAEYVCAEAIPGDYLEFGVFQGESFLAAYTALEAAQRKWNNPVFNQRAYSSPTLANRSRPQVKSPMRYFAFDSFQGLPTLSVGDHGSARFCPGRYDCSEAEFLKRLSLRGVPRSKVITIPGWYDATLNPVVKRQHHLTAASVIMVDCDLYHSTQCVLAFISDLLQQGTILIFDDWFSFQGHPGHGEQRAVQEWLRRFPTIHLTPYYRAGAWQQSFLVTLEPRRCVVERARRVQPMWEEMEVAQR